MAKQQQTETKSKIQEALDNTRVKENDTNKRIVDPYKDKKKVANNTKEFSKIKFYL